MSYFVNRKGIKGLSDASHTTYPMLDETNGCLAGFSSGISLYTSTGYSKPGVHEDQEGFVVMEGKGWAKVGDEEYRLEPDICFIAPPGVPHTIKRDPESIHVKVCWFHGSIQ